jgi:hypothetical protein
VFYRDFRHSDVCSALPVELFHGLVRVALKDTQLDQLGHMLRLFSPRLRSLQVKGWWYKPRYLSDFVLLLPSLTSLSLSSVNLRKSLRLSAMPNLERLSLYRVTFDDPDAFWTARTKLASLIARSSDVRGVKHVTSLRHLHAHDSTSLSVDPATLHFGS